MKIVPKMLAQKTFPAGRSSFNLGEPIQAVTSCRINDSKFILAYNSASRGIVLKIGTVDVNGATSYGEELILPYSCNSDLAFRIASLSETTAIIVFKDDLNGQYGTAVPLIITDTTITPKDKLVFISEVTSALSIIRLSDNKAFVIFASATSKTKGLVITLNELNSFEGWVSGAITTNMAYNVACDTIDKNKVLISYSSSSTVYSCICSIDPNTDVLTVGGAVTLGLSTTSFADCIVLSSTLVMVYGCCHGGYAAAMNLYSVSGSTLTSSGTLSTTTHHYFGHICKMSEGVVGIYYKYNNTTPYVATYKYTTTTITANPVNMTGWTYQAQNGTMIRLRENLAICSINSVGYSSVNFGESVAFYASPTGQMHIAGSSDAFQLPSELYKAPRGKHAEITSVYVATPYCPTNATSSLGYALYHGSTGGMIKYTNPTSSVFSDTLLLSNVPIPVSSNEVIYGKGNNNIFPVCITLYGLEVTDEEDI